MSLKKEIARRACFIKSVFVNSCRTQISHRFTYLILVIIYSFPGNINGIHYLLHIVSRIFSKYTLDKIHICCCWTAIGSIFQVKIASFISLKLIMDGRNGSTIPVNNINFICSIIFTITFFKAIKYNMPQMLPLAIHIE